MTSLHPASELLTLFSILLAAGAAAGFLAGLFGIGGGALLVPVFYQILGLFDVPETVRMHVCVGTSLAIILPTSLRSFQSHRSRGVVDMELLRSFSLAVPLGVIAASIVAAFVSGRELRGIFAVIALLVAAKLLFARQTWKIGSDIPGNPLRFVIGWLIGLLSTFMGIGGGVFNNTFMTMYGRPMLQSVATSSGVGVLISIPGVFGYIWAGWGAAGLPPYSAGYVNLLLAAVVIPMTILLAPLGVKAAHAMPRRVLEVTFGLFLLSVSARFFWSLTG